MFYNILFDGVAIIFHIAADDVSIAIRQRCFAINKEIKIFARLCLANSLKLFKG